jgi:hypothetical protein
VFHFWNDGSGTNFGLAILTWPVIIVLAITIAIVGVVRNASRAAPVTPAAPAG